MNDLFSIQGRNAVVTGAAMGIGFGIAKRFVEAGANVLMVDQLEGPVFTAAEKLVSGPGKVIAMMADVAADASPRAIVSRCIEELGSIDVLVNNAGISPMTPLLKMDAATFDAVWRVNLRAVAMLSKTAAARMIEQGEGGAIINIGSIDSVRPSMAGLAAYDASKGAVLMFTKSLALELAPHDIRVNAILPGGIETEGSTRPRKGSGLSAEQTAAMVQEFVQHRVPLGRLGAPDDVAGVVQFAASDAARYMTGAALVVDGGALLT